MPETHTFSPTETDLELARVFYSVLVRAAHHRETVTYGELIERAKLDYPENEAVQKAIPVSVGRRLDVVRMFTSQRNLPDLSSLVVNKTTGECGVGFGRSYSPNEIRSEVFAFDWQRAGIEFAGEVNAAKARAKPNKKLTEDEATKLMFEHFRDNKASLPPSIKNFRREIISLIMSGVAPEEAFAQVLTQ